MNSPSPFLILYHFLFKLHSIITSQFSSLIFPLLPRIITVIPKGASLSFAPLIGFIYYFRPHLILHANCQVLSTNLSLFTLSLFPFPIGLISELFRKLSALSEIKSVLPGCRLNYFSQVLKMSGYK